MPSDSLEHTFDGTLVAGCDPSSKKLAVVVAHPDGRITTHVWQSTTKKWEPSSCLSVSRWISCEFGNMDHGVLWIEEPAMGASVRSSIVQAFVSGAAQSAFLALGWEIRLVNNMVWKKAVVGHGKAPKDDVATAVAEHWPEASRLTSSDGDLTDAAAILLHGRGPLPPAD